MKGKYVSRGTIFTIPGIVAALALGYTVLTYGYIPIGNNETTPTSSALSVENKSGIFKS